MMRTHSDGNRREDKCTRWGTAEAKLIRKVKSLRTKLLAMRVSGRRDSPDYRVLRNQLRQRELALASLQGNRPSTVADTRSAATSSGSPRREAAENQKMRQKAEEVCHSPSVTKSAKSGLSLSRKGPPTAAAEDSSNFQVVLLSDDEEVVTPSADYAKQHCDISSVGCSKKADTFLDAVRKGRNRLDDAFEAAEAAFKLSMEVSPSQPARGRESEIHDEVLSLSNSYMSDVSVEVVRSPKTPVGDRKLESHVSTIRVCDVESANSDVSQEAGKEATGKRKRADQKARLANLQDVSRPKKSMKKSDDESSAVPVTRRSPAIDMIIEDDDDKMMDTEEKKGNAAVEEGKVTQAGDDNEELEDAGWDDSDRDAGVADDACGGKEKTILEFDTGINMFEYEKKIAKVLFKHQHVAPDTMSKFYELSPFLRPSFKAVLMSIHPLVRRAALEEIAPLLPAAGCVHKCCLKPVSRFAALARAKLVQELQDGSDGVSMPLMLAWLSGRGETEIQLAQDARKSTY